MSSQVRSRFFSAVAVVDRKELSCASCQSRMMGKGALRLSGKSSSTAEVETHDPFTPRVDQGSLRKVSSSCLLSIPTPQKSTREYPQANMEMKAEVQSLALAASHAALFYPDTNTDSAEKTCGYSSSDVKSRSIATSPVHENSDPLGTEDNLERQLSSISLTHLYSADINSRETSSGQFGEASQTLIFFDFDDTLFPTSYLFDVVGLPTQPRQGQALPSGVLQWLEPWRKAFVSYLTTAMRLSERCVVVTNAKRPWVSHCIKRFVPEAESLFDGDLLDVVYASEQYKSLRDLKGSSSSGFELSPVRHKVLDKQDQNREINEIFTKSKQTAMKKEAEKFYSRYPGQTWKNIISIGDMPYEHDALQEVTFMRVSPPRENLRTKVITVPTKPTLEELTLRLQFGEIFLPAYIHHDGDIDLDLPALPDPCKTIAAALDMPTLGSVSLPRLCWGAGAPSPKEEETRKALEDLSAVIEDEIFCRLCSKEGITPADLTRLVSS